METRGHNGDWPIVSLATLPVADIGIEETAEDFIRRAGMKRTAQSRPFYSTSANGHVIALCRQDRHFDAALRDADQIHADGMSLVLFSRHFSRTPLRERVATTDLVEAVAHKAQRAFTFFGATEAVNRAAVEKMQRRYPDLVFAGRRNGYFRPEDEEAIVAEIASCGTDILWIGLGIPLEQHFVSRNLPRLGPVAVIKTCGGLFDFLSGAKSRAPRWMQMIGLEWLYRAMLEPRRLGMRYLTTNPVALYALFKHRNAPPEP